MKKKNFVFVLVLIVLVFAFLSGCRSKKQESGDFEYSPDKYYFDLTLNAKELDCKIDLECDLLDEEKPLTFLFYPLAIEKGQEKTKIKSVEFEGERTEYSIDSQKCQLIVKPDKVKAGRVRIIFDYTISLSQNSLLGYSDKVTRACFFYPVITTESSSDSLDLSFFSHSLTNRIFDFEANVKHPKSHVCVCSGEYQKQSEENGQTTISYSGVNVRDFCAVASSSFAKKIGGDRIPIYYYYLDDKDSQSLLTEATEFLEITQEYMGDYPGKCLKIIKIPSGENYLSASGMVFLNSTMGKDETKESLIWALSAEWWGYKIGCDYVKTPFLSLSLCGFWSLLYPLKKGDGREFEKIKDQRREILEEYAVSGKSIAMGGDISRYLSPKELLGEVGSLCWLDIYSIYGMDLLNDLKNFANDRAFEMASINSFMDSFPAYRAILSAWLDGSVVATF